MTDPQGIDTGIDEFELISWIFAPLSREQPFALNLEDDAAVITPGEGRDLVVSTDSLSAGVHFFETDEPEIVAARALGSNVSDLTAMAASPVGYTLAIAAPAALKLDWYERFAAQLDREQRRYGIGLLGGDTTAAPGGLTLTITVIGEVAHGKALRRNGARTGDDIWVTGFIGDAALGLDARRGTLDFLDEASRRPLIHRFEFPEARIGVVDLLRRAATAGLDVSDGLVADLGHLARASGLHATILLADVPLSPSARLALERAGDGDGNGGGAVRERILGGGDDYEVLFTADPAARGEIDAAAVGLGFPITRLGSMSIAEDAPAVRVLDKDGKPLPIAGSGGYRHFHGPGSR